MAKSQKARTLDGYTVITELDVNVDQLKKRQQLIRQIEVLLTTKYSASNRIISYVFRFGHARAFINYANIAPLETILNSISGAQQINVLLHSSGGDGTIIEKMVGMCRSHLAGENRKLRVIVPNIAKSAATVFALGADTIIMGYLSELGPIDPQVQIVISGMMQQISALAFVESRDSLMKQIEEATKKRVSTTAVLWRKRHKRFSGRRLSDSERKQAQDRREIEARIALRRSLTDCRTCFICRNSFVRERFFYGPKFN